MLIHKKSPLSKAIATALATVITFTQSSLLFASSSLEGRSNGDAIKSIAQPIRSNPGIAIATAVKWIYIISNNPKQSADNYHDYYRNFNKYGMHVKISQIDGRLDSSCGAGNVCLSVEYSWDKTQEKLSGVKLDYKFVNGKYEGGPSRVVMEKSIPRAPRLEKDPLPPIAPNIDIHIDNTFKTVDQLSDDISRSIDQGISEMKASIYDGISSSSITSGVDQAISMAGMQVAVYQALFAALAKFALKQDLLGALWDKTYTKEKQEKTLQEARQELKNQLPGDPAVASIDDLGPWSKNLTDTENSLLNGLDASLSDINEAARINEGAAGLDRPGLNNLLGGNPSAFDVNAAPPNHLSTPRGAPGWEKLAEANKYYQSAMGYVKNAATTHQPQRNGLLSVAQMSLQAADASYKANDAQTGDGFWDNAMALIDGAFDYSKQAFLQGINTTGNFMAGVINGATGFPPRNSDLKYEDAFIYGKTLGAVMGLAGDAAAIIGGMTMVGSGGAAAVISGGTLVPVGATAGAAGVALAGAGASMAGVHYGELKDALDSIYQSKGSGRGDASFYSGDELAKRLNTTKANFHNTVKPQILKDAGQGGYLQKIGTKNPDIGVDNAGTIILRNRSNGKSITTDLNVNWYRS
jgi:hypothetical protein